MQTNSGVPNARKGSAAGLCERLMWQRPSLDMDGVEVKQTVRTSPTKIV